MKATSYRLTGLQFLTVSLGFVGLGCESETRGLSESPSPDATIIVDGSTPVDASTPSDAGIVVDTGIVEVDCGGPNPAGCTDSSPCQAGLVCDHDLDCKPSSCLCLAGVGWSCTRDCGGGVCRPPVLTFRLDYTSDVAGEQAYVQTSGGVPWVSVYDDQGQDVAMDPRCDLCPCDQCGSCPVCGLLPAATGRVGTIERTWDLTTHRVQRCPSAPGSTLGCQDYSPLTVGHYVARFCYGYSATTTPEGELIDQPICHDVPFDWPTTQTVIEHRVCDCG